MGTTCRDLTGAIASEDQWAIHELPLRYDTKLSGIRTTSLEVAVRKDVPYGIFLYTYNKSS